MKSLLLVIGQISKKAKRFLKKSNLPDINPSKTCSSILKESRFPKQWKDASVQHVCRYTHCSLNGKDHSTVQNSFSFLKSKANKHFSSKEFYFFEKSGSCLEKQKINRENEGSVAVSPTSEIIVHTKKPSDDYFVEIYANRNGKIETFSVNKKSGSLDLESNLIVNSKDCGDKVTNTCSLRTKSINSIDQGTEYSDELKLSVENAKSEKEVPKCKENGFTISQINNREDIEETRRDPSPKIVKDIVDKHVEKEVLNIDFSMHGDSKLPDDVLIPANIPGIKYILNSSLLEIETLKIKALNINYVVNINGFFIYNGKLQYIY
ncbi:hypothetical protein ZOSMA_10G01570 [Zostera marina]|uniref:Uncharacterized protein n=1 Tax=Zostera marina TaxID=29655 RepID=A0A0K9Q3X7_ZOSMR|nr:hypothetical protein ZOSMA_10G01570 [Zostera marina]